MVSKHNIGKGFEIELGEYMGFKEESAYVTKIGEKEMKTITKKYGLKIDNKLLDSPETDVAIFSKEKGSKPIVIVFLPKDPKYAKTYHLIKGIISERVVASLLATLYL